MCHKHCYALRITIYGQSRTPVPTVCVSFESYFVFHFSQFGTPSSVAKPRVLNDSLNDCQTPRCPSPQARPSSPTVCTSIAPSPNFAFCIMHFALAPRASPIQKYAFSNIPYGLYFIIKITNRKRGLPRGRPL